MLFANKKEEIESALVREAYRRGWERFAYHFPEMDGMPGYAHVVFYWDIPLAGRPLTHIAIATSPDQFAIVDRGYIVGTMATAEIDATQNGFDPTNPRAAMRVGPRAVS